jgi:hypothetical protein
MPVKRRSAKRRDPITEHEAAWLRGDSNCGFVRFKRQEELQALWDSRGDNETMHWDSRLRLPEPR